VVRERAWLEDQLREEGFEHSASAANFVFVKPTLGVRRQPVADALRERRVADRHYDREPIAAGSHHIGTREQHEPCDSTKGDPVTHGPPATKPGSSLPP